MTITFNYKRIDRPEKFGTVHVPAIPLTLFGEKETLDVVGLVDSGADFSVISRDLADILGVDLSKKPEDIGGIGGHVQAILSSINVHMSKGHESYRFPMRLYVVTDSMEDDFPILIGRADFFNRFRITFDEGTKKLSLKKI